jgi:predicted permease
MVAVFAELLSDRRDRFGRARLVARSLIGLLVVGIVEWVEVSISHGPRVSTGKRKRGAMGLGTSIRHAIRTLRKAPAFSVTSVALVAVGVGAVTTIFTLVDHVLLRPLPYPSPDRLMVLQRGAFQGPFFRELEGLRTVDEWGAAWNEEVNLVGEGEPLRLRQSRVSDRFFHLFGARTVRGRLFVPEDVATANAVIISAGAWQRIWGADPSVVGRTIRLDGVAVTVIGVMEPSFTPPEALVGQTVDVWRPMDWSVPELNRHTATVLQVAGRLAGGSNLSAMQAELDQLLTRMADVHENYRERDGGHRVIPAVPLAEHTVRNVRTGLGLLLGAVGLLLLVACANVANLFLARGLGRMREMAVRRALGAGNATLTGQLLVESLVVGLTGGLMGIGLAVVGIRAFLTLNPTALPRQSAITIDPRVVAFAIAISAVTSVLFGLLPALRSVRGGLAMELRGAGRSATTGRGVTLLRNGLIACEVSLSLVLVAGAGLLLRSFLTVQAQSPGFMIDNVWVVPLNLASPESPEQYREIMDEVLLHAEQVPGVRSAAYALAGPMEFTGGSRCCWSSRPKVAGREDDGALLAYHHPVTAGYFETLGIELFAGRGWTAAEASAEPVPVVLDETLAREISGSAEAAIGTSLGIGDDQAVVVGVSRTARHYGLDVDPGNALYLPMERLPFPIPISTLAVRVEPGANRAMPTMLREAIRAAAPGLPVTSIQPMRGLVDRANSGRRFDSVIFGAFAAVSLLLAAGGLYGTLLYLAGQRKRELGIRLALGATRSRIQLHVVRSGVALAVIGVAVGLLVAWMSNRLLESRIWGISRTDPVALAGAASLLLLTAVLASWLPARRAGRVDPIETLRNE